VAKQRGCVVVVCRRRRFGKSAGPFFAAGGGDPADFTVVECRPALEECSQPLSPIMARARFDARVVIQIAQMNGGSIAEGHLSRDLAVAVAHPLPMLFEKFP